MKFYTIIRNLFLTIFITPFLFASAPNWDCDGDGVFDDLALYESSGSVTAAVYVDGVNAGTSEGDLLGAFVDGELRGLGPATAVPFGPNAGTYAFLTLIYSNQASGETVTFKFYDVETDAVYDISETIDYSTDMIFGNVISPEIFNNSSAVTFPKISGLFLFPIFLII